MLTNDHVPALQISIVEVHYLLTHKVAMDLVEHALIPSGRGVLEGLYASIIHSLICLVRGSLDTLNPWHFGMKGTE